MSATPSPLEFRKEAGLDPAATGDPVVRVRYRYGMLLGADDFTLEQRSHLLRHRVHQALHHGAGTVWGLGVRPHVGTDGRRELKVGAGLAIDPLGREVFVPVDLCLDLSGVLYKLEWSKLESVPDSAARRVYVVLCHERAESQPVPAIRPPGASDADAMAYSRVEDRYRVELMATCPADPGTLLMGWLGRGDLDLEGRSIASLRDALVAWITGPAGKLDALWSVEETPLVLASVDLVRDNTNDLRSAVTVAGVNNAVRALCPSLPLLHEQLLGQRLSGVDGGVGCRVRAIDVSRASGALGVDVRLTAAVDGRTKDGARLLALGPAGWSRVSAPVAVAADGLSLRISPEVALAEGSRVQVLIPGQGEGPVLGLDDGQPLGGWWDDPLPAAGRGLDVSWVGTWSEVVS